MNSRFLAGVAIAALATGPFATALQTSDAEKQITTEMRGLRGISDADRPGATKKLALAIRALAPGQRKVGLAYSLANLSTEGDFGRDTLQAVATTLADAVQETPEPPVKGEPAGPYMELAQLEWFEHVSVRLKDDQFAAAKLQLAKIEKARSSVDFTLKDISGNSWTLSRLKGKVVVVNFWATWCPPCRKEMPDLEALYGELKSEGLVILAISDEESATVSKFIADKGYTYPILLDPGRKVNEAYAIEGIPHTCIYDRKGRLAAESIDMRTRGQFVKLLAKAGLTVK